MKTLFVSAKIIETVLNRPMFPSSLKVAETTLIRIFLNPTKLVPVLTQVLFTLAINLM